jgi:hypothetical protein
VGIAAWIFLAWPQARRGTGVVIEPSDLAAAWRRGLEPQAAHHGRCAEVGKL